MLSSHTSSIAPMTSFPLRDQLCGWPKESTAEYIPLPRLRHVPSNVSHPVLLRQELVQIADALAVFGQQLAFSRLRLARLDQVEDVNGRAVPPEKIVKMPSSPGVEGVLDRDYVDQLGPLTPREAKRSLLSMGGLGVIWLTSWCHMTGILPLYCTKEV